MTDPTSTAWSPSPLALSVAAERRKAASSASRRLAFLDGALFGLGCVLTDTGELAPVTDPAAVEATPDELAVDLTDPATADAHAAGAAAASVADPASGPVEADVWAPPTAGELDAPAGVPAAPAETSPEVLSDASATPPAPAPPADTAATPDPAPEPDPVPTPAQQVTAPPPPPPATDGSWLPAPGEPPATLPDEPAGDAPPVA